MRVALDTNILAYAEGLGDEARCREAREFLARLSSSDTVLPVQVLGELSRVLTGKAGRSPESVCDTVLEWGESFLVADSSWPAFLSALDLMREHHLPVWDALILSVAAEEHCRVLYSEDFHEGFLWRGVKVINPFRQSARA